jgi:hypothetical protein
MELISAPGQPPKHLYATVYPKKLKDGRTLSMNFTSSPGNFGKFAFQGDSVTWTPPPGDIKRKNNAAWYVCEKQQLFLNLMDYLAPPPLPGCSDHTVNHLPTPCSVFGSELTVGQIHFYNDAKANN